jgi:hypothetical protein
MTMTLADRFAFLTDLGMLYCMLESLSTAKINVHGERRAQDINFYTLDGKLITEQTHGRQGIRTLLKPVFDYWRNLSPLNDCGEKWENPFDPYHFFRRVQNG